MASTAAGIRRELRQAGLTARAIDAVWPEWWSDEAESSVSAGSELRFTLARRLGISPSSLFEGPPKFVWRDEAKFKSLTTETSDEQSILASFGLSVGRAALAAVTPRAELPVSPFVLRDALLESSTNIGLLQLAALCWGLGIPALALQVFPLHQKRMHAMTVRARGNHGILMGRTTRFPAQAAYILAHEIGHIALNHVAGSVAVIEMQDPIRTSPVDRDEEEAAADRYALALLTGYEDPQVSAQFEDFNSTELAAAAVKSGPQFGIDPGVLVMCLGHTTGRWPQVFTALRRMPGQYSAEPIGRALNDLAVNQLDWPSLSADNSEFLRRVLDLSHASD